MKILVHSPSINITDKNKYRISEPSFVRIPDMNLVELYQNLEHRLLNAYFRYNTIQSFIIDITIRYEITSYNNDLLLESRKETLEKNIRKYFISKDLKQLIIELESSIKTVRNSFKFYDLNCLEVMCFAS